MLLQNARRIGIGIALCSLISACGPADSGDPLAFQSLALQLDTAVSMSPHGGAGHNTKNCSFPGLCTVTINPPVKGFNFPAKGRLRSLRVWAGSYIDGIELSWQDDSNPDAPIPSDHAGGFGGTMSEMLLDPDEAIVRLEGASGQYIDRLTVVTNKQRRRTWGGNGGTTFVDDAGQYQREIHGFSGIFGNYIDNLRAISYLR